MPKTMILNKTFSEILSAVPWGFLIYKTVNPLTDEQLHFVHSRRLGKLLVAPLYEPQSEMVQVLLASIGVHNTVIDRVRLDQILVKYSKIKSLYPQFFTR